eukprot:Skav210341  [mRNA]  locus=scaffold4443:134218:137142:- [translate_table: standard]
MLSGPKKRLKRMCAQDLGCVLWAFAMLQWKDSKLFEALAQAVREHFSTLKPLDVGNVAWALSVSGQMDLKTATLIANNAMTNDFGTAEGWVHVLCALKPVAEKLDKGRWEQLLARFEGTIFNPLCQKLKELGLSTRITSGTSSTRISVMHQELALLESWVGELQLEHLGPDFSELLATHCGLWSESVGHFGEAQKAIEAFQKTSATHSTHSSQATDASRASESGLDTSHDFRVGLHQSKARVFASALKCADQLPGVRGTFDLVGEIWIYISHWPCISCLAVLCQVQALAPAASLLHLAFCCADCTSEISLLGAYAFACVEQGV